MQFKLITPEILANLQATVSRMAALMREKQLEREKGNLVLMDMRGWGIKGKASGLPLDAQEDGSCFEEAIEQNTCGTVACLGGWMTMDPYFRERGLLPWGFFAKERYGKESMYSTEPTVVVPVNEENVHLVGYLSTIEVEGKTVRITSGSYALSYLVGLPLIGSRTVHKDEAEWNDYRIRSDFLELFSGNAEKPTSFQARVEAIEAFAAKWGLTIT